MFPDRLGGLVFYSSLPASVRFATNGEFRESMQYRYDSMGNIIEVSENGRMVCRYEYDALNRLTREDNVAFGKTSTWTYDNNGNIVGIPGFASIIKNKNSTLESCQSSVEKNIMIFTLRQYTRTIFLIPIQ